MKEKRTKARISTTVRLKSIEGSRHFYASTADIGKGGMLILTKSAHEAGEQLTVEFTIPTTDHTVRCKVEVVYSEKRHEDFALHTHFLGLSKKDYKKLSDAVDSLVVESWFHSDDATTLPDTLKKEKRNRKRIHVPLWIKNISDQKSYFPSKNLSLNGIYLLCPTSHPVGTALTVEFRIPNSDRTITSETVVVHTEQRDDFFGIGLKFTRLFPPDHRRLEAALNTIISEDWFTE